ncbi:glutathione S-transferase [Sulfitobacter albidus]|uniref:Glutathione S-transferase n=1 Tax=Sulfitobacter albidus TaxID=2829501 RepID=A0A975JF23_9RHOB|nr:glutathione S-transferase [Sulfitobacter albidus]QUJ76830.1 glutathione S-transferase [Sulfitobacter albidus]
MITVHHLNRSRSLRILWLLEEIGEPYDIVLHERDAQTNLAPPVLKALHPLGKSPVVDLDGRIIMESAAIAEVLCARYAPHLVPQAGSDDHIAYLEWMHFAEGSAMTPILLNLYVGRLGEAGAPLHPRINDELDNHFGYMEACLRPSGYFVGDALTAADILLSFPAQIAMRLRTAGDYPKIAEFVSRIEGRAAFQRAVQKGGI